MMSGSEPQSAAHRYNDALGRSGALPMPEPPKAKPRQKPKITVISDGTGTPPGQQKRPEPKAEPRLRPRPDQGRAVKKLLTTTEALSAEERKIISGYRLSMGGASAEAERRRIAREVRDR